MQLPGRVLIGFIEGGNVYLFKNPNFNNVEHEHYHVVVNHDPQNEDTIILVNATSQIEKRKMWVSKNKLPKETLIEVGHTECPFLSKDTVFDCNNKTLFTKDDLVDLTDSMALQYIEKVPYDLLKKIRAGLIASPMIEGYIKEMLKDTYVFNFTYPLHLC